MEFIITDNYVLFLYHAFPTCIVVFDFGYTQAINTNVTRRDTEKKINMKTLCGCSSLKLLFLLLSPGPVSCLFKR